ncbi:hypothetical protein BJ508DRAFT_63227 [Ascobolus immersus RN42]|uniref:Uncharacterized protein n=1 Tax=Ascobolus immersus RN42 TaxID=1160509 RepID=A0A3N4IND2_ASCIM|nr:hypothetical protein BJ508DRAFT_63227 [Ascobolus immersus RN42]
MRFVPVLLCCLAFAGRYQVLFVCWLCFSYDAWDTIHLLHNKALFWNGYTMYTICSMGAYMVVSA